MVGRLELSQRRPRQSTRTLRRSVASSNHGQGCAARTRGGTGGEPSRSADAWFLSHVTKRILSSPSVRAEKRSHPCVAEWGSAHRTQGTPDPSARSPHECARDPPVGCASAAGLLLCVRSDGTVSHVVPPAPPRGVAPRPPGQGDGRLCRRSTRVSKGNDFSGKKRGINYFIR